jgi:hypothetical protein
MIDRYYIDTVRLLLESVPVFFEYPRFAMKGGTAINLFVHPWFQLHRSASGEDGVALSACVGGGGF